VQHWLIAPAITALVIMGIVMTGLPRQVTIPFSMTPEADNARITGSFKINRGDANVGEGSWATGQPRCNRQHQRPCGKIRRLTGRAASTRGHFRRWPALPIRRAAPAWRA
jgi:hypothetical protein